MKEILKKEKNVKQHYHFCMSKNQEIWNPATSARMTQECGRSMVEMLGVLAVVGVLSVGGVAMYTNAMNKHRANELLNEVSKRATVVAMQKTQGKSGNALSVSEFKDNKYGVTDTGLTGQFAITVDNVDNAICQNLMNSIKDNTPLRYMALKATPETKITTCNDDSTDYALVFNNNMSTTNSGEATATCTPACQANQECVDGNCIAKADPNTPGSCAKNSDCNDWCNDNNYDKCYCAVTASYLGNDSICYNNFEGSCAEAATRSDIKDPYIGAQQTMTWWSAVNFCKAHNKSLVSLSDLGITGGYQETGKCSGNACTGTFSWADLDIIKSIPSNCWTSDAANCDLSTMNCTIGNNNYSCRAFDIYHHFDYGVGNFDRQVNYSVLCH